MKYKLDKLGLVVIIIFTFFLSPNIIFAQYYSESGYYGESGYYSESGYYGEGSYGGGYSEGGYYGEGGYDNGYAENGYATYSQGSYTTSPPGPFGQNAPVGSCLAPGGASKIRVSWTPAPAATDYLLYFQDSAVTTSTTVPAYCQDTSWDENGNPTGQTCYPAVTTVTPTTQGGWTVGNVLYYDFQVGSGFIPGHSYSFLLRARNAFGTKDSNTAPYPFSYPTGWGHQRWGWTTLPVCSPPGNFTMTPVSYCAAVGTSRVHLDWTQSSSATNYNVYYRPNGSSSQTLVGSTNGLAYNIDSPTLTPGNSYQFLVEATSTAPTPAYSNGGWSSPADVRYCSNPAVNLTIDTGDIIRTISSGSSVQLNYTINNAYNCTTSATPAVAGVTTPWTSIYPSSTAVTNPGTTSGSATVTLFNNSTYQNNSYLFKLSCNNPNITGLPTALTPAERTVQVDVTQNIAPFIQTTQGDVHSNKDIRVPSQDQ